MTIEQLKEAIRNLEDSIETTVALKCNPSVSPAVLQSILDNYRELLKYKEESIGLSRIEVGDTLYGFVTDNYLCKDDDLEYFTVNNIIVSKDGIFYCEGPREDIICDLESLQDNRPFNDIRRVFTSEETARKELIAARKRLGYEILTDDN